MIGRSAVTAPLVTSSQQRAGRRRHEQAGGRRAAKNRRQLAWLVGGWKACIYYLLLGLETGKAGKTTTAYSWLCMGVGRSAGTSCSTSRDVVYCVVVHRAGWCSCYLAVHMVSSIVVLLRVSTFRPHRGGGNSPRTSGFWVARRRFLSNLASRCRRRSAQAWPRIAAIAIVFGLRRAVSSSIPRARPRSG